MPANVKNAIERRIQRVEEYWNEFAVNPDARLMRWLTDSENAQIVDAFVQLQSEDSGESPDYFLRFEQPFESFDSYSGVLCKTLREMYEEQRDALEAEGIDNTWQCPVPEEGNGDLRIFTRACGSFWKHYADLMERMVIFLTPTTIASVEEFHRWFAEILAKDPPEAIRFMMVDNVHAPFLGPLADADPARVVTQPLDLDMADAHRELARGDGPNTPDRAFRKEYASLTNAAGKGDVKGAELSAKRALTIAKKENWPAMGVVTHFALAAAYTAAGNKDSAIDTYRRAGVAANAADKQGAEEGPKLILQARMAEGAALVEAERYEEAAEAYAAAVPMAQKTEQLLAELECQRMRCFCLATLGEREQAWEAGKAALAVGEQLEPEQRLNSTLPYVGRALRDLAANESFEEQWPAVSKRLDEALGEDWAEG
ncbi:hypothetical protein Pan216_13250 [Planctomycetes bacterium Pan216]|uniref:Tetratricopeptide repeat protein n=1 Tax=Kolteria novifilia TaxID=2527975 RepID=A0A518B0K3_9BACT|nr:hypothetical protein Pan216_13250 [Planctomycetes bacterium Pan216]